MIHTVSSDRRRLSYSQQRGFFECRWRYREMVLRRRLAVHAPQLQFGGLAHLAIEHFIRHLIETQQELAPQDVDKVWRTVLEELEDPLPEGSLGEARKILRRFSVDYRLDLERVWKPEAQLAVNCEGEPVAYDAPDAHIRGIIDLVLVKSWSGQAEDWKTSRIPISEAALQEDLQARTYAMLLGLNNPRLTDIRVTFHFVRFGVRRTAFFGRHDVAETLELWRTISDVIHRAVSHVDDDHVWKPMVGPQCTGCPVAASCPLGLENLKQVAVLTPDDQLALAERILAVEAGLKGLKAQAKEGVKKWGPTSIGGGRFDFFHSPRWQWNVPRVMVLAKEMFVEPTTFLTVDNAKLQKWTKDNKPLRDKLQGEARVDVGGTTFSWKKWKGDEEELGGQPPEDAGAAEAGPEPGE